MKHASLCTKCLFVVIPIMGIFITGHTVEAKKRTEEEGGGGGGGGGKSGMEVMIIGANGQVMNR